MVYAGESPGQLVMVMEEILPGVLLGWNVHKPWITGPEESSGGRDENRIQITALRSAVLTSEDNEMMPSRVDGRSAMQRTDERTRFACARCLRGLLIVLVVPLLAGCSLIRPYDQAQRKDIVEEVGSIRYAPPPAKPLSLADSVQLALSYNLDACVKKLECEIQAEAATGSRLGMLPSANLKFAQDRRSNARASRSQDYNSGQQNLSDSISSERRTKTYSLGAAWNLVDFGLSYLRARQAEEEVRIREERYRRMRQNLTVDVVTAYWQLVTAKQAADLARTVLEKSKTRRARLQEQVKTKVLAEITGLEKEQTLVQMQMRLRAQERELAKARAEFAKLIGLAPGADFEIEVPAMPEAPAQTAADRKALEEEALRNRPELAELVHREQIQRDEVEAEIIRMFPHVNLMFDREHDSNKFLTHRTWHTIGVSAAWNLLSLPQRWKEKCSKEKEVDLTRQKRMALAVGVMTQVHLALLDLQTSLEESQEARDLDQLQQRLFAATQKHQAQGEADEGKVLEREADACFAHIQYLRTYADCRIAEERLANTLGRQNYDRPVTEPQQEAPDENEQNAPPVARAGAVAYGDPVSMPHSPAPMAEVMTEPQSQGARPISREACRGLAEPPETDSPAEFDQERGEQAQPQDLKAIRDSAAVLFPTAMRKRNMSGEPVKPDRHGMVTQPAEILMETGEPGAQGVPGSAQPLEPHTSPPPSVPGRLRPSDRKRVLSRASAPTSPPESGGEAALALNRP